MNTRDTLLVVDDMEINRAILCGVFEQEYNILEAENGEQALQLLEQHHTIIAAMLLDIVMPKKDGYEVLSESRRRGWLSEVPVVIITANDSTESEVRVLDLGASDIIMKPFEPHVVKRRVQNIIELNRHKLHLEELVEEQAKKLRESNEIIMDALSSVIEYRDAESGQHILRIRMFTKILLEEVQRDYPEYDLNERTISIIASASAMHDVGKIAVPDAILNKPGKLTDEEREIMKSHSIKGAEILAGLDRMSDKVYLKYAYNICRYHHERWDGSGYPDGLKGENIPICAQVVGIADAFDALTADRVYRKALPADKACNMILNGECGVFSPKLLECFKAVYPQFAELSHQYADGRSVRADTLELQNSYKETGLVELQPQQQQFGQMKYMAMLRYANLTVMEADFDTGIYHMVYTANNDFDLLRKGDFFTEVMGQFIAEAVHPDDRSLAGRLLEGYLQEFLQEGLMEQSREYRIYHKLTGEYIWYRATLVRIDLEDPKLHKFLMIWQAKDARSEAQRPISQGAQPLLAMLAVTFCKCRVDRHLTLVEANNGLHTLLGYTLPELAERVDSHYIDLLAATDRVRVLGQLNSQLRLSSAVELEYRLQTKDARTIWVLHKGQRVIEADGEEYLYGILIDITRSKQAQEEMRAASERYNLIFAQTNDIIFEWEIKSGRLIISDNWQQKFGYPPLKEYHPEQFRTVLHFHPGDLDAVEAAIQKALAGAIYQELELRIMKVDGQYIWCMAKVTVQVDERNQPVKLIGVFSDIDNDKKAAQMLRYQADRDALTKLYNKAAAKQLVERSLAKRRSDDEAVLLIIDVDNFKLVNDQYGHMFGDAVLVKIAERLQSIFRSEDILARIGGDEFMAYVHCVADDEVIKAQADQIIQAFAGMFAEISEECQLSASIGAVKIPADGIWYQELFQRCDQALYQAKAQGKNRLMIYDRTKISCTFGSQAVIAANTRIESNDLIAGGMETLVRQAFTQLYESDDVEQVVNNILAMVGQQFNVSRVYIFENTADGLACCNTFEWCGENISPEKEYLQRVTFESLDGDYNASFGDNGIFYCADISELPRSQYELLRQQGIKSVLQCAVRDGGQFVGFVGFDDCRMHRLWTKEQIEALTFISEVVAVFLFKKRAQDKALQTAENLRILLDRQDSWIFVIDPDTFQLRYINEKTQAIAPRACLSMTCYQAFFERSAPCQECPACDIRQRLHHSLEVYNPVLKVWSQASATLITWDDREACMLYCSDITQYKKTDDADKS